jgi:hypothetical protein
MDTMGDADELDVEVAETTPVFTPEARAITAAGLVLTALMAQGLFQYLAFFLLNYDGGPTDPGRQFTIFAAPAGVLAAAGAVLGWTSRRLPATPGVRGLAMAAAVVGAVIVTAVVAGIAVAFADGSDRVLS